MTVQITESIIIKGKAEKIFDMWSDLSMLPHIIPEIHQVEQLDNQTSRWEVKGPLGKKYHWTAQVTRFDQDRRIGWRTIEGDIKTSGQVTFQDLPQNQTEMTVMMQYVPPAGKVGDVASKVLEDPREKVAEGLRDFKTFAESTSERVQKDNKDLHPGGVTQNRGTAPRDSINELKKIAWEESRAIIEMTTKAGSGHPSSSLSAIDILTVLYFGGFMRYDPQQPYWPDRDRFILSKGHAAPGLYAVLAQAGYFSKDLLPTLRQFGSPLQGHPVMHELPGVEASTGSLGQGLSIGLGHALAGRIDNRDYHVYVMIGDGESDEGEIWEAAMAAAKFNVDHLTVILDNNQFQQSGPVSQVMPSLSPIVKKWQAFDWEVFEIDGHNFEQIIDAFARAREVKGKPQMIVAHTDKGRFLTPFDADQVNHKHGVALKPDEAKVALAELDNYYQESLQKE